jgi:hypothetical protein
MVVGIQSRTRKPRARRQGETEPAVGAGHGRCHGPAVQGPHTHVITAHADQRAAMAWIPSGRAYDPARQHTVRPVLPLIVPSAGRRGRRGGRPGDGTAGGWCGGGGRWGRGGGRRRRRVARSGVPAAAAQQEAGDRGEAVRRGTGESHEVSVRDGTPGTPDRAESALPRPAPTRGPGSAEPCPHGATGCKAVG